MGGELLSYLRELQRELSLAVVLVHHTRKHIPSGTQAGEGLRGSSDLHNFGDSNLYLRRARDTLVLSVEPRAAASPCLRSSSGSSGITRRGPPRALPALPVDPPAREALAGRILRALESPRTT